MKTILGLIIAVCFASFIFADAGDLIWKYKTGDEILSSPCIVGKTIFFGCTDWNLYALNTGTGNLLWKYKAHGEILTSSPHVSKGIIYIGDDGTYMNAVDATTGEMIWCYEGLMGIWSSACTSGNFLFFEGWGFYALNSINGVLIWKNESLHGCATPCYFNNTVYIGSGIGYHFYSFRANDGKINWRKKEFGGYCIPILLNDLIFLKNGDNNIYAVKMYNGEVVWKFKVNTENGLYSALFISNGILYLGSTDRYLYALNAANGSLIWKSLLGAPIYSSPVVANTTVYIGSDLGYLHARNISDGSHKWVFKAGAEIRTTPCIEDSVIYFGCNDGYLYAVSIGEKKGFNQTKTNKKLPKQKLSASPNPFSNKLTLTLPQTGAIYSLTGRLVKQLSKGRHKLRTNKWKPGVYVVKTGKLTQRIVKIR